MRPFLAALRPHTRASMAILGVWTTILPVVAEVPCPSVAIRKMIGYGLLSQAHVEAKGQVLGR